MNYRSPGKRMGRETVQPNMKHWLQHFIITIVKVGYHLAAYRHLKHPAKGANTNIQWRTCSGCCRLMFPPSPVLFLLIILLLVTIDGQGAGECIIRWWVAKHFTFFQGNIDQSQQATTTHHLLAKILFGIWINLLDFITLNYYIKVSILINHVLIWSYHRFMICG